MKKKRRSYEITKAVKILRYMRLMGRTSMKEAGKRLGISDSAISHIENGKMELPQERIFQMVIAYGFTMCEFKELCLRSEIPVHRRDDCKRLLDALPDSKLEMVLPFLMQISK